MFYAIAGVLAVTIVVALIVFKLIKNKHEENAVPAIPSIPDTSTVPDTVDSNVGAPNTSGRAPIKKAVLVGINKYRPDLDADLKGCVNDIENVRDILIRYYGFDPDNIRVLVDDRAIKASIIERLVWLVDKCVLGDELVFDYSGHGSQVRDREGDELEDQMDEIICPYDLNWDDPLTDDVLARIFSKVPEGVYLTVIIDACHSGTMTKNLIGCKEQRYSKARFIMPPFDIRARTIGREYIFKKNRLKNLIKENGQNHVLLSGCKDDQTSEDTFIDGKYQGAMTWAFTSAVKEDLKANWESVYTALKIKMTGFTQEPQLSGDNDLLIRPLFGGH